MERRSTHGSWQPALSPGIFPLHSSCSPQGKQLSRRAHEGGSSLHLSHEEGVDRPRRPLLAEAFSLSVCLFCLSTCLVRGEITRPPDQKILTVLFRWSILFDGSFVPTTQLLLSRLVCLHNLSLSLSRPPPYFYVPAYTARPQPASDRRSSPARSRPGVGERGKQGQTLTGAEALFWASTRLAGGPFSAR